MVTVPVESQLLPGQLSKVAFGRLCSFGLQGPFDTEIAAGNLFPMTTAQKLTLGSNCWMSKARVNSDNFTAIKGFRIRQGYDHVQPETTFTVDKVSSIHRITCIFGSVFRYLKTDKKPVTRTGSQVDNGGLPVEFVCMYIITSRAEVGAGLGSIEASFLSGKSRFNGFGGFGSGLNNQVTNQPFTQFFNRIIGSMVEFNPILFGVKPTIFAHKVKGQSKLFKGLQKHLALSACRIQFEAYGSLHSTLIQPYIKTFIKGIKGIARDASKECASSVLS